MIEEDCHWFVKIWTTIVRSNSFSSRNDLYKSLALMALAQQGKMIDERILENYGDRGDRHRSRRETDIAMKFIRFRSTRSND